jgi:hypothetical protein
MPCKHYKDALIEAAAGGVEPSADLRAHLNSCAECRAAFEQERTLFAAIDAGLRVTTNAEVPVSLLPSVRARLDEEAAPKRSWAANWLVLASAAALFAGIFVARAVWRPVVRENSSTNSAEKASPAPALRSPREDGQNSEQTAKNNQSWERPTADALSSPKVGMALVRHASPEVLVPQDQEVLLAEYAEQWHQRKHAPLVARDSDTTILAPLEVAQIQIAELDVKLLADEKSQ